MLDLRYHVASLAAVFIALALGVVLGVAISGKVSDARESVERSNIEELRSQLDAERARTGAVARRGRAAEQVVEAAYPALVSGRLADKRFALIFIGGADDDLRSAVQSMLFRAGSGSPLRTMVLDLPLDPDRIDEVLNGDAALADYAGDDFGRLGYDLGRELIAGGETPILATLQSEIVEESVGTSFLPVDGAIVGVDWKAPPADENDSVEEKRLHATTTFVNGLLDGLDSSGHPVVGVETSGTPEEESAVELYRDRDVSSVDNVDTYAGKLALALLLADGPPGHYGVKDSADEVTPPIQPVTTETGGG